MPEMQGVERMTVKCYIHDSWTAQCPRCMHREYTFSKEAADLLAPEVLAAAGCETRCEHCGATCITVPHVTPDCLCKHCTGRRKMYEEIHEDPRMGLRCSCQ